MGIGTTDFPGALDSKDSLVRVANQASTTLATTINSTDTSIVLTSGAAFPSSGIVLIDSELIAYSSKATNTLTVQASPTGRGYESTTAAGHTAGAVVRLVISAASHNVQSDAIIATQTKIGTGSSTPTANTVLGGTGTGTSAWWGLDPSSLTVSGTTLFAVTIPGGADTNIQYNAGGVLEGSDDWIFTTVSSAQTVRLRTINSTSTAYSQFQFRKARGTSGTPTAVQSANPIGEIFFQGYNGAAYVDGANIQAAATANWSNSPATRSTRLILTVTDGNLTYPYNVRFDRFVPPSDNNSSLGESGTVWSTLHTRSVTFAGSTSGTTVIQAAATAAGTYTWPGSDGTSGQVLSTNGSGVLSWASVTASAAGADTQLQRNNSGVLGGITGATSNGTNVTFGTGNLIATSPSITTSLTTGSTSFDLINTTATTVNFAGAATTVNMAGGSGAVVNLGGGASAAELRFLEPSGSGTNYTALKAQAQVANVTYTLPAADGTSGQVLSTNGSGTLSWATASGGSATPAGSPGQVQFNSAGSFGGATGFTYQSGASPNVTITAQASTYVALSLVSASTPTSDVFRVSADNGVTTHFRITSTGSPSSPVAGTTNSERYGAGAQLVSSGGITNNDSILFGSNAYSNRPRSVIIGRGATTGTTTPDATYIDTVLIGYNSSAAAGGAYGATVGIGGQISVSYYAVGIGWQATVGAVSVGIGRSCNATGEHATAVGMSTSVTHAGSVAIGAYSATTGVTQFVAGSAPYPMTNVFFGKGVTNDSPTAYTINGTGGLGSNIAGANLTIAGGIHTGTPAFTTPTGHVILSTSTVGAAASTANSLVQRFIVNGARKALTDATDVNLFEVALPTLTGCAGAINFEIFAADATDTQVRRGSVQYSAVNKGGTYTTEIAVVSEAASVSTGTLTATWSILNGTNKITIRVNADTSLTPTTFYCVYTLENNSQQGITVV